ncbi:BNR repeat-containing protein [Abyssalbus ytuae]|uniref:BNR repeat-containing protein n=1 Tax=Abyssalbus ytuae TaxID=2926907 RepID=A0A9E7CTQ8_9FLAO|nr:BNR repeat-containing protein [Abyssalbus ytuae]UOB16617.1 BNR repeat-containing protein [Abyssalbus ytuae]
MKYYFKLISSFLFKIIHLFIFFSLLAFIGCSSLKVAESEIGLGWSNNSVNTVIFRNSAVDTYNNYQFTAYYDEEGRMILAKRKLTENKWDVKITPYKGNVKDAHNSISLIIDVNGYVHISWDQHNTRLRYVKSISPLSLELSDELSMTGLQEEKVTYPEFHKLKNGKLLFCYRSGESGRGNMVINQYDPDTNQWSQLQDNLLDGEELRSAYWQIAVDGRGSVHLSWVWRETWDVSTNHDLCYAVSHDGGKSWEKSTGEKYGIPIRSVTAEIAWKVPENSNLINQTSMAVDDNNNPYIATYWDADGITQYKIIYLQEKKWQIIDSDFQKKAFQLGGGGTKSIPISRPQILIGNNIIYLLFRSAERENRISLAYKKKGKGKWNLVNVSEDYVGQWEPNFDKSLWKEKKQLHIFSQNVTQSDGEGLADMPAQKVKLLEINNIPK